MGELLAKLEGVSRVYQKGKERVDVLHELDLQIEKGDFLALMGPSGSGKTTLLNLLGGLDKATAGTVTVGGAELTSMSNSQLSKWRAAHVGFIFQFYNLLPVLTARKNVELPLLLTNMSGKERARRADIALEIVGLADRAKHRPRELSGGQEQRVAIATGHRIRSGAAALRRAHRRPRSHHGRRNSQPVEDTQHGARQDHHHGDA